MKTEFSNPEFYKKTFEKRLEDFNEKNDIDNLTIISAYTQTMNSEIGYMFNDDFKKDIREFIEYSYTNEHDRRRDKKFLERVIQEIKNLN